MAVVLAIDAGTTSVRTVAVDEGGSVVDSSQREFKQHFPRPGLVEHDAMEIWEAVAGTLAEVRSRLEEFGTPIAAVGITDQRETVVAWDAKTSLPRHRAIVWQDRRTTARCEDLRQGGHLDLVRRTTGLVLDPYFSASKIEWLLTDGGVEAGASLRLGTIDSWLLWKLTGGTVHATEPSNASRTMLFDLSSGSWSDEMCSLFGIPVESLPEIRASSGRFGVTQDDGPLPSGIPVSGMAGDQQAALFGQACFRAGEAKNTYGTGSFLLANMGPELPDPVDGLVTTVAWVLADDGPATYALEGSIFATGATIQWLRDGLGIIDAAAEVGPLAASVADTGGVYLVPAFTGLGSPWWDPRARGTIIGLTHGSGRAHLARATVEAMAFQTRDVVEAIGQSGELAITDLRVDGGASVMDLLLEMQADLLNLPVTRSSVLETTAQGAAWLAGLAEGFWSSTVELADLWQANRTFEPSLDREKIEASYQRWLDAVERSRSWEWD
ncbi:MAG TPA: glycerol kinase [Acidimicrobiaceae bacterium]|jgi:glycerol kinase|nr:glycerol kinase [Acidimicrobiaceae bacterium]MDP7257762.1 glycerol kinase GlpK [Acidimicrobiales bacterium]HCV35882.1 glycerol kinase [Acidimicrobiaceae bacterium]HJO80508.1 glycerol kinase GlpK [Acidimicrobiales bacterium]|tara:strand:+ start:639 stop:2126 length:1488 start_codon:yes stop_codon:yes gene_type:complete